MEYHIAGYFCPTMNESGNLLAIVGLPYLCMHTYSQSLNISLGHVHIA